MAPVSADGKCIRALREEAIDLDPIIEQACAKITDEVSLAELDGKDILITGASGLVGTWLLYTLYAAGANKKQPVTPRNVYAVIYSEIPAFLKGLEKTETFHFLRGDLSQQAFAESLPKADYIIHCAGYAQPLKFMAEEIKALKINVQALFTLADKLNANGKLLFLSSCTVYTGNEADILRETDIGRTNTDHPRACYIEGKRCGETICQICRRSGVDAKSIRLPYTYGPGVHWGDKRAMYAFIEKAHAGDIHMLDAGQAKRSYLYIADAIIMIWKIFLYGQHGCYNIAADEECSIRQVAQIVAEHYHVRVIVPKQEASVTGGMNEGRFSTERYQQEFGRMEYTSLRNGLLSTMHWYDTVYGAGTDAT